MRRCRWMTPLVLAGQLWACTAYVPLGTDPPSNPDNQPPLPARIHLVRGCEAGPGPLEGEIRSWTEQGVEIAPETCQPDMTIQRQADGGDICLRFIPADAIVSIERVDETEVEQWVVITASVLGGVAVATGAYFLLDHLVLHLVIDQ